MSHAFWSVYARATHLTILSLYAVSHEIRHNHLSGADGPSIEIVLARTDAPRSTLDLGSLVGLHARELRLLREVQTPVSAGTRGTFRAGQGIAALAGAR